MTRIDQVEEVVLTTITVPEFEVDWKRGYCIVEWMPEKVIVVRDRYSARIFNKIQPRILVYACMKCQFSNIELEFMKTHLFQGEHLWAFSPFNNPYGHSTGVVVEGIETTGLTYREYVMKWLKENQS